MKSYDSIEQFTSQKEYNMFPLSTEHIYLENFLMNTVFRWRQCRYGSVDPDGLFAAFEDTIAEYQFDFGQDVTATNFMKQWTEQAGYPMINVVKANDEFVITQVRIALWIQTLVSSNTEVFVGKVPNGHSRQNNRFIEMVRWDHLYNWIK